MSCFRSLKISYSNFRGQRMREGTEPTRLGYPNLVLLSHSQPKFLEIQTIISKDPDI